MSLYKEWDKLISSQSEDSVQEFWKEYSEGERAIYGGFFDEWLAGEKIMKGRFGDLAEKYGVRPVIFMGFLDGAQQSIKNKFELDGLDEDSELTLDFDMELLFFNMLKADADYLYGLDQWAYILGEEKMREIVKQYKRSKTVVKKKLPGRNDPCWCGSGKKYKHCHMRSDEEEMKNAENN